MSRKIDEKENIIVELSDADNTPVHSHDFLELAYVLEGEAEHLMNENRMIIKKGDYFIIDYGASHGYNKTSEKGFKIVNCLFNPALIDHSLKKSRSFAEVLNSYMIKCFYTARPLNPANYVHFDSDDSIRELVCKLLGEYEEKSVGYIEILRCILVEIIVRTIRKLGKEVGEDSISGYISSYVNRNYADKNILGNLSEIMNFSLPYLSSRFKSETGISFSDYLKRVRVEQGCRLLANTDKKIIEIAGLVGYSDVKFFNKIFKTHLGMSPREYRAVNKA